jgi:hypothetical protein
MNPADKLATALWEADRHAETLREALAEWDKDPAADWRSLETDRERVRVLDQLLFRFIKLQDAMGERLVAATLAVLDEPFEDWAMRDRLNRLEKLGYIDVDNWLAWREIRNRLAHEYPDQPELQFAALLATIAAARALAALYTQWRARLEAAGIVRSGKPQ